MNDFRTIYEISAFGGIFGQALSPTIIFLIIFFIIKRPSKILLGICLVLFIMFITLFYFVDIKERLYYKTILNANKCSVAEGNVNVLNEQHVVRRGRGSSKDPEGDTIQVGGATFVIKDSYSTGPTYQKTISRGGALHNGVYARIFYYNDLILKIEIKKQVN